MHKKVLFQLPQVISSIKNMRSYDNNSYSNVTPFLLFTFIRATHGHPQNFFQKTIISKQEKKDFGTKILIYFNIIL